MGIMTNSLNLRDGTRNLALQHTSLFYTLIKKTLKNYMEEGEPMMGIQLLDQSLPSKLFKTKGFLIRVNHY